MRPSKKTASPSDYAKAALAIDLYGKGSSKTSACLEAGILFTDLQRIVREDPDLRDAWNEANAANVDRLVDVSLDANALMDMCNGDPKLAMVMSKNIQWAASRRDRERYGDRVDTVVSGSIGHSLDLTITQALDAGLARARLLNPEGERARAANPRSLAFSEAVDAEDLGFQERMAEAELQSLLDAEL